MHQRPTQIQLLTDIFELSFQELDMTIPVEYTIKHLKSHLHML